MTQGINKAKLLNKLTLSRNDTNTKLEKLKICRILRPDVLYKQQIVFFVYLHNNYWFVL